MKPIAIIAGIVLLLVFVWFLVFGQESGHDNSVNTLVWTGERAPDQDAKVTCELRVASSDRKHSGTCLGFHGVDGARPGSITFTAPAGCEAQFIRKGSSKYYQVQLQKSYENDVCADLRRIAQQNEVVLVEPSLTLPSE